MPSNPESPFRVDRLPRVNQKIKDLSKQARDAGIFAIFAEALAAVVDTLKTTPLTWGDPVYHTKHEGGLVLRGIHRPVAVQYVVYEAEQYVCILDLQWFP